MIKNQSKKKKNNNYALVILFAVTFIATLFLVGAMFKNFSPPVDVSIGGEELVAEDSFEDESIPEGEVDNRLKWIQFEDNKIDENHSNSDSNSQTEENSKEFDDKEIKKAEKRIEKLEEIRPKFQPAKTTYSYNEPPVPIAYKTTPPVPSISDIKNNTTQYVPIQKMTKVYVGYYPTRESANEVKEKITVAIPGYQPYVKQSGSQYRVQIASFTDRTKAVNFKLELSDKGFPARLLTE